MQDLEFLRDQKKKHTAGELGGGGSSRAAARCKRVEFEEHGNSSGVDTAFQTDGVECKIGLGPYGTTGEEMILERGQPKKEGGSFRSSGGGEGGVVSSQQ